ncbi:MAG: hypothetical protein WCS65_02105 [Verrucomicrobiae bacterium]
MKLIIPAAVCLTAMCCAPLIRAQNPPEPSVKIRTLATGRIIDGLKYGGYADGKLVKGGDLPQINIRFRSEPISYSGPQELLFFNQDPPASIIPEPDKPLPPEPVAKVVLPAGSKNVLLLFVPRPAKEGGVLYDVLSKDDSTDNLPYGKYLILNFTKREIGAIAESAKVMIPSSSNVAVSPGLTGEGSFYISFYDSKNLSQPVAKQLWYHYPLARCLIILQDVPGNETDIAISSISEFSPDYVPPKTEGAQ